MHLTYAILRITSAILRITSAILRITVQQVDVSRAERGGAQATPGYTFFSSEIFLLAGKIESGVGYNCPKCLQDHWPIAKTKTVLVTYSEVVAASGFPTSLTLPGAPLYMVAPTNAGECYDTVWVLEGLMADPGKIIRAIYGSNIDDLLIFLDLGTLAITQGESSSSVWDRLLCPAPLCTPGRQRTGASSGTSKSTQQTCPCRDARSEEIH